MKQRKYTVTLDEHTAARARVRAAERNLNLSRYIGEMLDADIFVSALRNAA